MSPFFLVRLALDGVAAGLLLFGLAYWWLGNTVHELAGTALFLLVILHNIFNRRWYGTVARTRRDAPRRIDSGVILLLAVAMLVLLATSLLISETLSGVLPSFGLTVRQLHIAAAYWALVIVAVHLGLRWPMILGVARSLSGIAGPSKRRTVALRLAAAGLAGIGAWSSFELGIGSKLAMRLTLDWWNFEESVAGFFLHAVAVVGLWAALTHAITTTLRQRWRRAASVPAVAEDVHQ